MQGKITFGYSTPTISYWVLDPTNKKPVKIIRVKVDEAEKVMQELESKGYIVI